MNKKLFLILLTAAFMLCVACGTTDGDVSIVSERSPDSAAAASYTAALGTTVMGYRVVVKVPLDNETQVQSYLVFENENDSCALYRYHFYPSNVLYEKDKNAYAQGVEGETLITADDGALMLKIKSEASPYATLEGAYAAYYSVDGFTII